MNFKIPQNELSKCINIVQKGISNRTTLPILEGILIKATNGILELTATDLELGIKVTTKCEILEEGSVVITSKIFGDIIKKLPNSIVIIDVDSNKNMIIDCENSHFNITGQSSEEYPSLPEVEDEIQLQIPKDLLKTMIKQTIFSIAQDETRPILTGELLEIENNKAALVALDGYRLALKNIPINCKKDTSLVIPGKTLNELLKILDDDDSNVIIKASSNHILFDLGHTVITSTLLEGQFLNYKDIIRNEYNSKVKVKTKLIQESIERASLLAREGRNNLVKLDITDETLSVMSNSDIGNVHEEIAIELEGNDIKIAFNSKYILDALKIIESEEIIMKFVSNVNPCIITPNNDNTYIYLVLPVRVADSN